MILGIWYSNNAADPKILKSSLDSLARTRGAEVITCPWYAVVGNPFRELLSYHRTGTHLGIFLQALQALYDHLERGREPEAVAFLEHDVLYPEDYFERVRGGLSDEARGVYNLDYIGMDENGYCKVNAGQGPAHQQTLRFPYALEFLEGALKVCAARGSTTVEPEDKGGFVRLDGGLDRPAVHINHTKHFTSHYKLYSREPFCQVHPYWGDYRQYYPAGEHRL
jgi:hypothetical protein